MGQIFGKCKSEKPLQALVLVPAKGLIYTFLGLFSVYILIVPFSVNVQTSMFHMFNTVTVMKP